MLETIGYDAAAAASFAPWDAADASVGRVAQVDRGVLTVLTEDGPQRVTVGGALLARIAQDPAQGPCPGDWVVVRTWPDRRETVEHVLDRRTVVLQEADGRAAVLAANVDLAAVVVDVTRVAPEPGRLRRLLDLARSSGAVPLVLLSGVAQPGTARRAASLEELAAEVVPVDVGRGTGLARLRELVGGRRTLALLGVTETATAPVAQALVGAAVLGSRRPHRGLTVLPGGGAVLDLGVPRSPSAGGWHTDNARGLEQ